MNLIKLLFTQTWIIFILVTIANGLILRAKSKKYIGQNPALAQGYKKFFKGWIVYGNISWLIMGIGNLSGLTKSVFDYFTPRQFNPIVIIFHVSIIIIWFLGVRWIYFQNGAEFIEQHPGLFRSNKTAKQIKLFLPFILLGGLIGMIMMWFNHG